MLIFSLIFCPLLICLVVLNVVGISRNKKRQEINEIVSVGLDTLIHQTREQLHKNQKLIEKAKVTVDESKKLVAGLGNDFLDSRGLPNFESAPMLSSLITVMIKKYGTTALSLSDFTAVDNDDYVSVYVQSQNGNIILSIGPTLNEEDPLAMMNFVDFDDKTYN